MRREGGKRLFDPAPDLPTDGIEDPVPGILAMPPTIQGPNGIKLRRYVGLTGGADFERWVVNVTYGHPKTKSFDPRSWYIRVVFFQRPGLAHERLHRVLDPMNSVDIGPDRPSWTTRFERLGVPGLLVEPRPRGDYYGGFYGVLRQSFLVVQYLLPRKGTEVERQVEAEKRHKQARSMLDELMRAIASAPPAEVKGTSRKLGRVQIKRPPRGEGPAPVHPEAHVTIEPREGVPDDEGMKIWVSHKGAHAAHVLRTSAGQMRREPAIVLRPKSDLWAAGEEVVLMRVSEEGHLATETIRLRLAAGRNHVEWKGSAE